jgi:concanavalin A-like lectin/glucanase superfamily protein
MASFLQTELLAGGWLRALSLSDPGAPVSLRPDHGSNGAYDAWPALASGVMGSFGRYPQMLQMLRTFAGATAEGPFSQSHELVPEPSGLVVWDRDDLNPQAALTVTAWIRPGAWPGDGTQAAIVAKDAAAGAWFPLTPPNVGYTLRGGGQGVISFAVAVGGKLTQAVTKAAATAGDWHHVAGTFDGQRITVYIDGAQTATATAHGAISPARGTNLMVGADPIDPQAKFTGAVDEVRVYSRALSAAEVADLAAAGDAGHGGGDQALVLRLPMDEGSGQSTADAVTGLAETVIAGDWTDGRFGAALSFSKSPDLTRRISRQQYNENNGGAFAAAVLGYLLGYAPDGQQINLRDHATPRGVHATLQGIVWRGRPYTLASTPSGTHLTPER